MAENIRKQMGNQKQESVDRWRAVADRGGGSRAERDKSGDKKGGTRALDGEQGPRLTAPLSIPCSRSRRGLELGSGLEFLLNLLLRRGSYS